MSSIYRTTEKIKQDIYLLRHTTLRIMNSMMQKCDRRFQYWTSSLPKNAQRETNKTKRKHIPTTLTYLLTFLLHGAESFLRSWPVFSQLRNSPHFMEPEGSLTHSQDLATCPYPEPARSSPYPHIPTSWRSILILSSHVCLGLPSGLFPSGFPTKTLLYLYSYITNQRNAYFLN